MPSPAPAPLEARLLATLLASAAQPAAEDMADACAPPLLASVLPSVQLVQAGARLGKSRLLAAAAAALSDARAASVLLSCGAVEVRARAPAPPAASIAWFACPLHERLLARSRGALGGHVGLAAAHASVGASRAAVPARACGVLIDDADALDDFRPGGGDDGDAGGGDDDLSAQEVLAVLCSVWLCPACVCHAALAPAVALNGGAAPAPPPPPHDAAAGAAAGSVAILMTVASTSLLSAGTFALPAAAHCASASLAPPRDLLAAACVGIGPRACAAIALPCGGEPARLQLARAAARWRGNPELVDAEARLAPPRARVVVDVVCTLLAPRPQPLPLPLAEAASLEAAAAGALAWRDLIGCTAAKAALRRSVILPVLAWQELSLARGGGGGGGGGEPAVAALAAAMSAMRIGPPSGVLLHGPRGCGKSAFAAALARACRMRLLVVDAGLVLAKYVGDSEASLRALYRLARRASPCCLVFDNFHIVGGARGGGGGGGGGGDGGERGGARGAASVHDRMLATLLTELDGVGVRRVEGGGGAADGDGGGACVLTIGLAERADDIDAALLRPGRLGVSFALERPPAADLAPLLRRGLADAGAVAARDLDARAWAHLADTAAAAGASTGDALLWARLAADAAEQDGGGGTFVTAAHFSKSAPLEWALRSLSLERE